MAVSNIILADTVGNWVAEYNTLSTNVGDITLLSGITDSNLVAAINELVDKSDSDFVAFSARFDSNENAFDALAARVDSNDTNFTPNVRSQFSAIGNLSYDSSLGQFSVTANINSLTDGYTTPTGQLGLGACVLNTYTSTGANNTAVGFCGLSSNTTGSNNTALGAQTLKCNTTGRFTTAIGSCSLNVSTGCDNTALGFSALFSNTTGACNVAIGSCAGSTTTSGANTIAIGYNAQPSSGTASNEITLGNANITKIRIPGILGWEVRESGTNLIFTINGTDVMKLDTSGNLTVIGDVTAHGTI